LPEEEEIFLTDEQKHSFLGMNFIELFEIFFSEELKSYIIEATTENGYELSSAKFNVFLGVWISSIINSRKRERDFWSKNDLLRNDRIVSAISRNEFLNIKRFDKVFKKL